MAKQVVRYLLEGVGTVPAFVENGGYFPLNEEMVGVSVDEDIRHVPATVVRMSRADLLARIAEIAPSHPQGGEPLDAEEQEAMLDAWLESVGLPDLA